MRVTRAFIVTFAVSMAVAGCQRPVAVMPYGSAPGIDGVLYGQGGPAIAPVAPAGYPMTTGSVAAPRYAMAPGPAYAAAPPANYAPPPPPVRYAVPTPPVRYAVQAPPVGVMAAAYAPTAQDGPYTLDSGDRLRVVVFGQDGLTNAYVVDASGYIAMPLIGTVLARGATTEQLSARIAAQLRQGFIREPHVAVEIEAYRPFFILGEVTQPGQYPYVANMTAETAVAIAGGFGPRGVRDHVVISRNVGGRVMRFAAPMTCPIRPGDTVIAQERWF